ncbi:MAG: hypothetical protein UW84_C0024G0033 [Candidatus Collierbacteria bacterium GW2011_GWA2_44_99]|uniref:Uncharacterized protein n=1 Tax=Candidatus Collierbacteria bacterium GW2011_GWA2_44_99 TaxID=1618380 RepID=A0A0G1KQG0_9BACT|nr:MAG: hypothetical protein UW84_C0024G0033 [Candidatus Collierbacteria bacterium GW2011_GWA2_44_99]
MGILTHGGEDEGTVGGEVDGFFEHGRERAVLGRQSPAVRIFDQMPVPHSYHSLDSHGLVYGQNKLLVSLVGEARNKRLHVKLTADPMAGEVTNDVVARAFRHGLHGHSKDQDDNLHEKVPYLL